MPVSDRIGAGNRGTAAADQLYCWKFRRLVREMSIANPFWGAPRIHGELLKLGVEIGQTSVAKYMARRRGPPSQGWKTFLRNHADGIVAMDLFVVPTISFRLLYGLLIVGHGRRQILWFGVTAHPTAEWLANQLTEACGWEQIPHYQQRPAKNVAGPLNGARCWCIFVERQMCACLMAGYDLRQAQHTGDLEAAPLV